MALSLTSWIKKQDSHHAWNTLLTSLMLIWQQGSNLIQSHNVEERRKGRRCDVWLPTKLKLCDSDVQKEYSTCLISTLETFCPCTVSHNGFVWCNIHCSSILTLVIYSSNTPIDFYFYHKYSGQSYLWKSVTVTLNFIAQLTHTLEG